MTAAVEVLKQMLQCFQQGDLEGVFTLCSNDVKFVVKGQNLPWSGTHVGREAVLNNYLALVPRYFNFTGMRGACRLSLTSLTDACAQL